MRLRCTQCGEEERVIDREAAEEVGWKVGTTTATGPSTVSHVGSGVCPDCVGDL